MQDPFSFQAENLRHEKFLQMTQTPVRGLVCRMAVPTMISMMISAFYNMVDTFYCTAFVKLLGAIETVQSYAEDYLLFLVGAPFMTALMVLNHATHQFG